MRRINTTRGRLAVALAVIIAGGTGCGLVGDESADASDPTGSGSADAWPRTVTNCGEEVTIAAPPERIVGIEGAAETVMALGAGDQLAGWFGNEAAALPEDLRDEAEKAEYLGGSFPAPTLEDVIAPEPDLVVLYGYTEDAGLTKQAFDDLGVPTLVLSETCAEGADPTVDGYFADVENIARAIGADERAAELVASWRSEIDDATATPLEDEVTVFINGNPDPSSPFASGGGSLADDQIRRAGGVNVFGDTDDAFLEPSWEEVATRNPDVIVDGSGGLEESTAALRAYLAGDRALSQMTAVREDAILTIEYYDNVPGPRVVDGIVKIAEFLRR